MGLLIILRPRKPETLKSCRIKEAVFGFSLVFLFAALVPATVSFLFLSVLALSADLVIRQYIMAMKGGVITKQGVPPAAILQILSLQNIHLDCKSPFSHPCSSELTFSSFTDKYQTPVKAYCIVGWFCWLSTLIR